MAAKTNPANLSFTDFEVSNKHHNTLNIKHIRIFRMYIVLQCCSVAVQKMVVWKYEMNSISIYIDIELFFAYGKGFLRTATLQHCNTMLSFNRFRWKVFTPFSFSGEKKSKKVVKNSWTAMTMFYLCTRKIEHAPACNRRSTSFRVWDAVHVITREMRKKRPLPQIPFKVPIRMRLLKKKTEVEWNGKWLTFVLWQTYIPQK